MISITFIRVKGKVTLFLGHSLTFQFDLPLWLSKPCFITIESIHKEREIGSPFHELGMSSWDLQDLILTRLWFLLKMSTSQGCRWGKSKSVPKNGPQFLGYYFRGNSILYINRWNYKVWHSRCSHEPFITPSNMAFF